MSNKNVTYTTENGLHIVSITGKSRLIPIVREREELFQDTVKRASSLANLTVCINASWYGLTSAGSADALYWQ